MNQMTFILGALALIAAVPSLGNAKGTMAQFQAMREQSAQDVAAHAELMLDLEAASAAAQIAEQRYLTGCEPVVDWTQTNYVGLIVGQPVNDPITQAPIAVGVIVCDAKGGTGEMVPGPGGTPVVGSFAFTGNREAVLHRLRQYPQFNENMIVSDANGGATNDSGNQ